MAPAWGWRSGWSARRRRLLVAAFWLCRPHAFQRYFWEVRDVWHQCLGGRGALSGCAGRRRLCGLHGLLGVGQRRVGRECLFGGLPDCAPHGQPLHQCHGASLSTARDTVGNSHRLDVLPAAEAGRFQPVHAAGAVVRVWSSNSLRFPAGSCFGDRPRPADWGWSSQAMTASPAARMLVAALTSACP